MGLADELYEANQPTSQIEKDELGVPVADNADYLVARAMVLNHGRREDEFTVYQLHLRGKDPYFGHEPIKENYENLVRFTEFTGRVSPANKVMFWEILKRHLPKLNRSIIQVGKGVFWDIEKAKLITKEELPL